MAELQFDLPLGDTEAKKEELSGFQVGYQETKLRSGVGIADKTYQKIITSYPDYNDNADAYQEFASLWDNNRVRYTHAMNNRTFALDDNNEIVDGEGHFAGASLLYDMDAMKGYLLAEKNGFNQMGFDAVYGSITEEEAQKLGKAKEGTSLMGNIVGTLAAYVTEPETIVDFASPGKVIGSTIAKGAAKAFLTEALYATASETMRQKKIMEHMERAGLEYSLWDATKEVIINSGFAGTIRGLGSAIVDWRTFSKINKGITNSTDKEIFTRFAKRENFKLTQNTTKHLHLVDQVEADIERGVDTDISLHTDIDINTKADEAIEPTNFREELSNDYQVKGYDADEKILDDNIKAPEIVDDVYEGMATKEDGDALIKEFATHPEIEAELKEIEALETRLSTVQEHPRLEEALASGRERSAKDIQSPQRLIQKGTIVHDVDKFGGEDKIFRVPASYEKNYAADFTLTKRDLQNYDKGNITPEIISKIERDLEVLDTNPDYQLLKEAVGDGMYMQDGIVYKADGTELFAKGLDNIIAGGVAGIEVDENGNLTLDPEKFVLGMAGLSVAKRLSTMRIFREALSELPEVTNRLVKKATGLDIEPKIVPDVPGGSPKKADDIIVQHNLTAENIKHAEDVGGLAVPSLAVSKASDPLTGFGEITLLGHSDLIKPSRDVKVFGADIYSPRYPQIHYNMSARQQRVIDEDLAPYEAVTGSKDYSEKNSLNALYDNTAFRAKFLDEKGVKVKLAKSPKPTKELKSYNKYYKKIVDLNKFIDSQMLRFDPKFQQAYLDEMTDIDPTLVKELELGEALGMEASQQLKRLAYKRASELQRLGNAISKAGKPDEYEIKKTIREIINKKKLGFKLKEYASDYLKDIGAKETIYTGTDRQGRGKYIEHTLSNVVSQLKKDLRGGESFNYGLGTTRSKLTPEFKTIKRIQAERNKLVSSEDFELVKKEMQNKVDDISDKLKPYYDYDANNFGYNEQVLYAIGDQDLPGYGFTNVPNDIINEVNELITALKEMPTEYFEVKILKALDVGEFKAAVVPNGTSKETIQILKDKGLKVSKYNPSNADARAEAIKKTATKEKILFMHPVTLGGAITAATLAQEKDK